MSRNMKDNSRRRNREIPHEDDDYDHNKDDEDSDHIERRRLQKRLAWHRYKVKYPGRVQENYQKQLERRRIGNHGAFQVETLDPRLHPVRRKIKVAWRYWVGHVHRNRSIQSTGSQWRMDQDVTACQNTDIPSSDFGDTSPHFHKVRYPTLARARSVLSHDTRAAQTSPLFYHALPTECPGEETYPTHSPPIDIYDPLAFTLHPVTPILYPQPYSGSSTSPNSEGFFTTADLAVLRSAPTACFQSLSNQRLEMDSPAAVCSGYSEVVDIQEPEQLPSSVSSSLLDSKSKIVAASGVGEVWPYSPLPLSPSQVYILYNTINSQVSLPTFTRPCDWEPQFTGLEDHLNLAMELNGDDGPWVASLEKAIPGDCFLI